MSFTGFVIVCVVGLVGYYLFLILRPEKNSINYDNPTNLFDDTELVIEPPITVSMDMVSFVPTVDVRPREPSKESTESYSSQSNTYNASSVFSRSSLSGMEITSFLTSEAIEAGKQLFSNISFL